MVMCERVLLGFYCALCETGTGGSEREAERAERERVHRERERGGGLKPVWGSESISSNIADNFHGHQFLFSLRFLMKGYIAPVPSP